MPTTNPRLDAMHTKALTLRAVGVVWQNHHHHTCPVHAARTNLVAAMREAPADTCLHGCLPEYDGGGDQEHELCTCSWRGRDEWGIVWDAGEVRPTPPKRYTGDQRDMGMTVFATDADRQVATDWLRCLGYRYFTTYKDAQGYGLSWAWGHATVRREARDRLPSVQRARRQERARQDWQGSLYKNPHYDTVH